MKRTFALLGCVLAAFTAGGAAAGAQTPTISAQHVTAEFVVRNASTAPGDTTDIAIINRLDKGWHTYWINPGDSGEPPIVEFDLKGGATAGALDFPVPHRLPYPPLMNFGYKDDFTLLTSVTVPADWPAGEPYRLPVRMDWLVCEAICIPVGGTADIVIDTDLVSAPDSGVAFTFVKAEWALPKETDAPATYSREGDTLYVSAAVGGAEDAVFFPEERGVIDAAAEQTAAPAPDGDGILLTLESGSARLDGTMRGVLSTSEGAWWITADGDADPPEEPRTAALPSAGGGTPGTGATGGNDGTLAGGLTIGPGPVSAFAAIGPLQAILFAFLGGLILNLMPCVFPVLALKVFGLVAHADAPFARRATLGAAYASGILTSFAVLAAVLLGLKSAGVAVGWGFQLQSPTFVAVMAAVILGVALNLSGVFEVGARLTQLGAHDK
ncbi:MAG: protein-disulfide reductase DsbD domain-containing protein, partial [Pseudomonadota bacterium]